MPDRYFYRRDDNGVVIEVGFDEMMQQDGGYITLSDGALAKRCVYLEQDGQPLKESAPANRLTPPIVSDTLGCGMHQVEELREDARRHGYRVEFTPDPAVPEFYQARIPTENEKWKYAKHRGLCDRNSRNGGGVSLTGSQLEQAAARLLEAADSKS